MNEASIQKMQLEELNLLVKQVTVGSGISITNAAIALDGAAKKCGFRVVAFHDLSSKNFIRDENGHQINETVFGWTDPKERWWDEPLVGLTSPVALSARYEYQPFWVNERGVHSVIRNTNLASVKFRSFFRANTHFRSMMIFPVHQPFGRIGVVCYLPLDKDKSNLDSEFELHCCQLSNLAHRFIRNFGSVDNVAVWTPENCTLTRRQVRCLHWASVGKTDHEIGDILTLSHAAVRYHVSQAISRLECVNRTQAVFKAGQLGYVGAIN